MSFISICLYWRLVNLHLNVSITVVTSHVQFLLLLTFIVLIKVH